MLFAAEAALEAADEEEEEPDPPEETRLVEARKAADRLLDPAELLDPLDDAFDCDAFEVTVAATICELRLFEPSRPKLDRLPRICGLIIEE